DARQILLALTAEGRTLHDRAIRFTAERNESMGSVLTTQERFMLLDMLDRLIRHNEALLAERDLT
ncbi:MAG: MarR family transcriptional regulator, partial [Rhodobacteraceae bacterium]|nr:MarR family transcriptional regulator [Paracoccaceae bacterium]